MAGERNVMKRTLTFAGLLLAIIGLQSSAQDSPLEAGRWTLRFDIGGTIAEDAALTKFSGPITGGGELQLGAGGEFSMALGYRLTPWLALEGEWGFAYNNVESVGNWHYPDSGLSQMLFMANVVVEKPFGRLSPFCGAGIGGDLSSLTFGSNSSYYYWYWEPDGEGSDFVLTYQLFAGVKYRLSDNSSLGIMYRYVSTAEQNWNVDWWTGTNFDVGVNAIHMHYISLVFSASF